MTTTQDNAEVIRTIINREGTSISANVEENYIFTTEDKIRILYDEYNDARRVTGEILSRFGVFLTLLIADLTCEFKPVWFLDAPTVKAVFYVMTLIFFASLIVACLSWLDKKEKLSFEFFISQVKGENPQSIQTSKKAKFIH